MKKYKKYNTEDDPGKPKKSNKVSLVDNSGVLDKKNLKIGPEGDYTIAISSPNLLRRQFISSKGDFEQDDLVIDKIRKTREGYKRTSDKEVVADVIDYYGKLYDSEFYNRNHTKETVAKRKLKYEYNKDIKTTFDSDRNQVYNPSTFEPKIHRFSRSEINDINYFESNRTGHNANVDSVTAHEMNHAFYEPSTEKLTKSKMDFTQHLSKHDSNPEEVESDINAVRYDLYRYNIWDMKRDINKSDLQKLNKLKNKSYSTYRAREAVKTEDDLIYLLNKVAYQNTSSKDTINANDGGKLQANDVLGLATSLGNPLTAIPSALGIIGKLAYNPASYTPAKMNESPMGYAYGGDMKQQLNMLPNVDKPLGEHAVEVQGKEGIDTNYRNIDGQNVALTKGEIVREDSDGSAYVWSNNPKMKHSSGETFAKAMKPVENKIAKIKRRIEKDPTDHIATNTLGHLEQIVEQNKNEEEMLRQAKGSPTAQAYNKGGYIKANDGIAGLQSKKPIYVSQELDPVDLYGGPMIPNEAMDALISGRLGMRGENVNRKALDTFAKAPKLADAGNMIPQPQRETFSTFEDKAFLGAKGLETVGRVANALQKPRQYDPRRYNVDKIKYNPNRVLDRNEANYQSAQFDINTGNANTDRILRNNVYGQKLQADRDVYREYDQMQRQSDLQVDQYNAQALANIDNINEQIQGRQQQARDAALTSIGNMASIFQQAGGAKAHNKITLATLNSLSKRYGIDVPNLMLMMEGQGDSNKGVVNYKGK